MTEKTIKRIVCYGDSNTFGFDPRDGGRYDRGHRWPEVMQDLLGDGFEVINAGFNGRTIATVIYPNYYGSGKDFFTTSMTGRAPVDLLILMLGSNDCIRSDSPEQIAAHMETLIQKALTGPWWRKGPQILLAAPIEVASGRAPAEPFLQAYSDTVTEATFNDYYCKSRALIPLYRALAKKYGSAFIEAGLYAHAGRVDHVHLTPESHVCLGQAMAKKVEVIFNP